MSGTTAPRIKDEKMKTDLYANRIGAEPCEAKEIDLCVGALRGEVEHLKNAVNNLLNRLEPVSKDVPPSCVEKAPAPTTLRHSPLGRQIDNEVFQVRELAETLRAAKDRLAI